MSTKPRQPPRPAANAPRRRTQAEAPVDPSCQSVAGEEDPGAALDLGVAGTEPPDVAAHDADDPPEGASQR